MRHRIISSLTGLLLPLAAYGAALSYGTYQHRKLARGVSHQPLRSPNLKDISSVDAVPIQNDQLMISAGTVTRELIIVDSSVRDKDLLFKQVQPGVAVVEVKPSEDGLTPLIQVLQGFSDLNAVHVVAHGEAGAMYLGGHKVDEQALVDNVSAFAAINHSIREGGDLMLYGCDLGEGEAGEEFLEIVKQNTHADVAASDDRTGNEAFGGDWKLEIQKGHIETASISDLLALKDFTDILFTGTIDFGQAKDLGLYCGYGGTAGDDAEVWTSASQEYYLIIDGDTQSTDLYTGLNSNGQAAYTCVNESSVTLRFNGDAPFSPQSLRVANIHGGAHTFTFASDNDSFDLTFDAIDGTDYVRTVDLTPLGSHVTHITISSDRVYANLDDFVVSDVGVANNAPTDITLGATSVNQSGGANAVVGTLSTVDADAGDAHVYSLVAGAGDTDNGSFNINGDDLRANDAAVLAAGNYSIHVRTDDGTDTLEKSFTISVVDDIAPTVSSVSVPANGTYVVGQNLDFTVNTSEIVNINAAGGTPQISLTVGASTRQASYVSGSGTSTVVFSYTVQSGDNDANGIAVGSLSPNGGTIRDGAGNDLNTTLNSVGSTVGVLVDGIAPAVSSVSVPTDRTYSAGENLDFTVNTSENVTVNTTSGTPQIALDIGTNTRQAAYLSGSGTSAVLFRYTVQSGDNDADGIAVGSLSPNGGAIRDGAGNDLNTTLNSVGATSGVLVDTAPPTGHSVSFDDGTINAAEANSISFTFAGAEVGADYSYTISSSGGTPVTGSGNIASAGDQISGIDVSGLSDGTLTLSATLTDPAGNTSAAVTDTAMLDATAPAGHSVSFDDTTIDASEAAGISFTFAAAEVGADYSYTISSSGGGTPVTGSGIVATAGDQISGIDVSGLSDGTLTLSVALADSAGNTATAVTNTATLDAAAPAGHSVSFDDATIDASEAAGISFTFAAAELGADYSYTISSSGGGTPVTGSGTIASASEQVSGIDVSGLPGGTLTLSVTLTDSSGNTSAAVTDTATLDTSAPSGHIVSFDDATIDASEAAGISFTFSAAEVGTDYNYTISSSGGGTPVTGSGTIASAGDQISGIDVSGLSDGTLTLSATLTDPAGNTSAAVTDTAMLDATAPAGHSVSFDDATIDASEAAWISFTFAGAEVGANYNYTISSSGGGTPAAGSGTIASAGDQISGIDVSGLSDGTLTLSVTLTDTAGNTSAAVTDTATLDSQAPTPVLSSSEGSATNSAFTATVDFGETVSGFAIGDIAAGNAALSSLADEGGGAYSVLVTPNTDGEVTLDIAAGVAQDSAGNASLAATQFAITYDATLPLPVFSSTEPDPSNSASFDVSLDFGEIVTGLQLSQIAAVNATLSDLIDNGGGNYSLTVAPGSDGTVTLDYAAAQVQDEAGNDNQAAAQFSLVHDSTAPAAPSVPDLTAGSDTGVSEADDITGEAQPTMQGAADADTTVSLASDIDGALGTTAADGAGNWSFTPAGPLSEGIHSLTATSSDEVGNESAASDALELTIDTTAPEGHGASFDDDPINVDGATAASFSLSSAEIGASYSYSIASDGGGTVVIGSGAVADAAEQVTGIDLGGLVDGTLTLSVVLTDVAGNQATPVTATATLSTAVPDAPAAPELDPASDTGPSDSDGITSDATPTLTGVADGGNTITVFSDMDGELGTVLADSSGQWSFTPASELTANASHDFTVIVTDSDGNDSDPSPALSVIIDTEAAMVTAVAVPADGVYVIGDELAFSVSFNEAVMADISGGTPQLELTVGVTTRYAPYTGGVRGTTGLPFAYTVQPGDVADGGITLGPEILLAGGRLTDLAGNDVDSTLNGESSLTGVQVDGQMHPVPLFGAPALWLLALLMGLTGWTSVRVERKNFDGASVVVRRVD